jgi:hypothetical protein
MNILSAQTAASTCPPGCAGHVPGDAGEVHISVEQTIPTSAGVERSEVYVSLEQALGQPPAVRLQGAGDTPMQPAEALQLAFALISHAIQSGSWAVSR